MEQQQSQQQSQQQQQQEDRKRVFAEVERQELEQQNLAPGFLEWRKAEDLRLRMHKQQQQQQQQQQSQQQHEQLQQQVKDLRAIWQNVDFKPGPERENYMAAMQELGDVINGTSHHTP